MPGIPIACGRRSSVLTYRPSHNEVVTQQKRPSAGCFRPADGLGNFFRLAYAGPATMTRIIMLTGTARMLPSGRDRFVAAGNIGVPNFECSRKIPLMQGRGGINRVNGRISGRQPARPLSWAAPRNRERKRAARTPRPNRRGGSSPVRAGKESERRPRAVTPIPICGARRPPRPADRTRKSHPCARAASL